MNITETEHYSISDGDDGMFNYMLLWSFPLALIHFFFTMYASCFGYSQWLGLSRCYDQ